MLVDAHAHLDQYTDNISEIIREINLNQILTLAVSMDVPSYETTCRFLELSDFIVPCFGVHPWESFRYADDLDKLDPYLNASALIGEIGLDYRFVRDTSLYADQKKVFEYILRHAAENKKIVNLHTSGAEQDVLAALEKHKITRSIVHWYSGSVTLIERFCRAGSYFTIGVEILMSEAIERIARLVPLDRLLTETDNPGGYQWLTGKIGTPILIQDIVIKLAEVVSVSPMELETQILSNFRTLTKGIEKIERMNGEKRES